MILLIILVVISYGDITSRGGYLDDFSFVCYTKSQSYLEAVWNWSQHYNSRISQGVILPGLLTLSDLDKPGTYNWSMFHCIGILAFLVSLFFINRILVVVNVPMRARLVTLLIFALHPVKNQALLWPATIAGYVIPFMIFSLATWFYLARAKMVQEKVWSLLVAFSLILFSVLAIEQLLPLAVFIVVLRLLMFPAERRHLVLNLSGLVVVISSFVASALLGKTAEKVSNRSGLDLLQLVTHAFETSVSAVKRILEHPIQIALDRYYWDALLEAAGNILFPVAVIVLLILMAVIALRKAECGIDKAPMLKLVLVAACGGLLFLVTLSPLMVVNYYLPLRALYIPLLGAAIVTGAMFEMLWQKCFQNWLRNTVVALTGGITVVFILINLLDQHGMDKYWSMEKSIIKTLQQIKHEVPSNTEINLYNIPKTVAPVAGIVDYFTFPSITNWVFNDETVTGSTLVDLSDVYPIHETLNVNENVNFATPDDHVVLFWQNNGLTCIEGLQLQKIPSTIVENYKWHQILKIGSTHPEREKIHGFYYPVVHEKNYGGGYKIQIKNPIVSSGTDVIFLPTKIKVGSNKNERLRLIVHVKRAGKPVKAYDQSVAYFAGFTAETGGFKKTIIIPEVKDIELISISLSGSSGILQSDIGNDLPFKGLVPINFF